MVEIFWIRQALKEDKWKLLEFENRPEQREFSKNKRITRKEHERFWKRYMNGDFEIYLYFKDEEIIGKLRLQGNEVSIGVHSDYQRRGIASELMKLISNRRNLIARSHPENSSSLKFFHRWGFKYSGEKDKDGYLILKR